MDQPPRKADPLKYWTRKNHYRFEDRVSEELKEVKDAIKDNGEDIKDLRKDVSKLSVRVAYVFGGFSIAVIIIEKLWK